MLRLKLFLVISGLILGLVATEFGIILLGIDSRILLNTIGDEPWMNPGNLTDPQLLHIHQANQNFEGVQSTGDIAFYLSVSNTQSYPFNVATDSDGFRNMSPPINWEVSVIGDSFVENPLVPSSQVFTTLLQKDTNFIVRNLGQIWYGPQQELAVLNRYGLKSGVKYVVWVFYAGNDFSDYIRYENKHSTFEEIVNRRNSWLRKSFSWNITKVIGRLLRPIEKPKALELNCYNSGNPISFFYQAQDSFNEKYASQVLALIQMALKTTNEHGAHFILAYAPSKLEVLSDKCAYTDWDSSYKKKVMNLFQQLSGNYSIVDLTPDLQQAALIKSPYFPDDTHWNSYGNEVVARTFLPYLTPPKSPVD